MKKSKGIISLTISVIMLIVMMGTGFVFADSNEWDLSSPGKDVFQTEYNDNGSVKEYVVDVNGYSLLITEIINEDHSVTRKYERQNKLDCLLNESELVAILTALGMSDDEIESTLIEEDIQSVQSFSCNIAYIKTNE